MEEGGRFEDVKNREDGLLKTKPFNHVFQYKHSVSLKTASRRNTKLLSAVIDRENNMLQDSSARGSFIPVFTPDSSTRGTFDPIIQLTDFSLMFSTLYGRELE